MKWEVAVDIEAKAGVEEFETAAELVKIAVAGSAPVIVIDIRACDKIVHIESADAEAEIGGIFVVGEVVPFSVDEGFVAAKELSTERPKGYIIFACGDTFAEVSLEVEVDIAPARPIAGREVEFARQGADGEAVIILWLAGVEAFTMQQVAI